MTSHEIRIHLRKAFFVLTLEQRFKLLLGLERGEVWFGKKPSPEAFVAGVIPGCSEVEWDKMLVLRKAMRDATEGAYDFALRHATAEDMREAVEVLQEEPTHGAGVEIG